MFIAKQRSAFSGFAYNFLDASGQQIGSLCWPDFSVATNARFKNLVPEALSTQIEIKHAGQGYKIAFEYLTRDWVNDIAFFLKQGDMVLASAKVIGSKKRFERNSILMTQPFEAQVLRRGNLFSARYEIKQRGSMVGSIAEKTVLLFKRELVIDLPETINAPIQFFMLFLVCNDAFS
jgi:hypothetical protein